MFVLQRPFAKLSASSSARRKRKRTAARTAAARRTHSRLTPMRDRVTWPDLEAALQARDGWRRVGREYHGPCPVSGAGRDCCFASEGRAGDVALGCRKCGGNGGKLDSESFLAHLAALVGETARHVAAHATNDRAAIETPSPLPAGAWREEASRGMQSRGGQETHKLPQKTNPAPPRTPPHPSRRGRL